MKLIYHHDDSSDGYIDIINIYRLGERSYGIDYLQECKDECEFLEILSRYKHTTEIFNCRTDTGMLRRKIVMKIETESNVRPEDLFDYVPSPSESESDEDTSMKSMPELKI